MKRLTKNLLTTGAILAATLLGAATPSAIADTSTLRLGCFVDSPRLDTVREDYCFARDPARRYAVYFEVLGRSGGAYTYRWNTAESTISSGCTSSSYNCYVSVRPQGSADWTLTVSVNVTEVATGASKTVSATAEGWAVCEVWGSLYWC